MTHLAIQDISWTSMYIATIDQWMSVSSLGWFPVVLLWPNIVFMPKVNTPCISTYPGSIYACINGPGSLSPLRATCLEILLGAIKGTPEG